MSLRPTTLAGSGIGVFGFRQLAAESMDLAFLVGCVPRVTASHV